MRFPYPALLTGLLLLAPCAHAQDYDALIQKALQQRNTGDLVAAERSLRQAWEIPDNKSEVAYLLGMVLAFQERFGVALDLLDSAIVDYPEDNVLKLARARVLSYQGAYREATLGVNTVLAEEPDNTDALNLAGRIALYQQRPSAAREQFNRVLQLDQVNLDAMLGLHDSHRAMGQNDQARSYLDKAALLAPDHIEVLSRQKPAVYGNQRRNQVTMGFSRSTFDLPGFTEWNDHFLEYRHLQANRNQQYLRVEQNHRFDSDDTLVELGVAVGQQSVLPVEVAIGFTADSDFMPSFLTRLQARKILLEGNERFGTMVLTGLYQHSVYNNGSTNRVLAGLEYYLPNVDAWLTPSIGTVRDQDGLNTVAWSMGAHWQLNGATRVGFNYSDAPETENLITTGSRSGNIYLRHDFGNRFLMMLYLSRTERTNSYTREVMDLILQYRF
ncbi:MAG: YaiO family outer membrane beta-barrel protein [Pseudohongiellaceae bacterium]